MIRKLYSFYDLPFDHDTCHLFEHLVLRTFLLAARKAGSHRAFIGTTNGQTIGSSVFFAIEVHDESTKRLFEHTLTTPRAFPKDMVEQSIRHIEAETSSIMRATDMAQLHSSLLALHRYINGSNADTIHGSPQLSITHIPDLFQRVVVSAETTDTSDHMTKIFYVLYPVVMDIIRDIYFDTSSAYPADAPSFTAYLDGTVAAQEYIIRKTPDKQAASAKINRALHDFDTASHAPHIARLAGSLRTDTTYTFLPIYCYEKTEVQTSTAELASLVTPQHLLTLVNALRISIKSVT